MQNLTRERSLQIVLCLGMIGFSFLRTGLAYFTTLLYEESISGIRVTQIFTREKRNEGIFTRLSVNYRKAWMKTMYINFLVPFSVDNLTTIVTTSIYFVGLLALNPAEVSFGIILAMSSYAACFWQPILNLSNLYNSFINAVAYLERIFETLDEPVTVSDVPDALELPHIRGRVTFDDVTFGYDPGHNILENMIFDVKPGERHRRIRLAR
jgi:ATP-binding cassette subfamily B multidrug efflux pump